jgi:hypothetical protein
MRGELLWRIAPVKFRRPADRRTAEGTHPEFPPPVEEKSICKMLYVPDTLPSVPVARTTSFTPLRT